MAKDGTNRGGRRVRAGDKPLPLADKISAGKAAKVLAAPDLHPESMLLTAPQPLGLSRPPVLHGKYNQQLCIEILCNQVILGYRL